MGAVGGYYRGWIDTVLMRLVDSILAFPGRLLAVALVASLGGGLFSLYLAIGVSSVPRFARIVRGWFCLKGEKDMWRRLAPGAIGNLYILCREILPNCTAPILVAITVDFAHAIFFRLESSLSFLGTWISAADGKLGSYAEGSCSIHRVAAVAAFFL